ncbi:MAG: ABC transporter permease [Anaerolineales bacterium]|nr:ABC transporter permease [Anaerolineales bacterium]
MNSLLTKAWHDLWSNKSRTIQVVLIIALGAFGIGLVIGGRNLIADSIADQWQQAEPPHIKLGVAPPLTGEQVKRLERIDGVTQAEGTLNSSIEWRLAGESEWQTALLEARDDFSNQKMELIDLISGEWPGRNSLGVIKTADSLYGVGEGNTIEVRSSERVREYHLTGTLKPVGPFPVVFLGEPVFYADRSTFKRLTGRDTYDIIQTRDVTFDQASAEATDLAIQDYFEDIGVDSFGVTFPFQSRIIPPGIPPAAEILNAIFLILGFIGIIIIALGVFLVYNSVNAIITQQVDQIGVMKAIGASSRQVFLGYFMLVLAYGLLAALISIPMGALGARGLQVLFLNLLNMADPGFSIDLQAISVQVAVAIIAPLLAALLPLRTGIRITVREAINTYGLTGSTGIIEQIISRFRSLPYSMLLVLSNTFRNRKRVFLIQITLVLAGVVFMMVLGVNDATSYTFGDKLTSIHNYQVNLQFEEMARTQRLEKLALTDPQVAAAESWLVVSGKARPVIQEDSEVTDPRIRIFGLPTDSKLYRAEIREGRWLSTNDKLAVVLTESLAQEKDWQVGDRITLTDTSGREDSWQVVGITYDPLANAAAFAPLSSLQRELGADGMTNTLWVQTQSQEPEALQDAVTSLIEKFESRGFEVAPSATFGYSTIIETVEQTQGGYSLIFQLLAIMAVIIALVGGVGLSGVLTLNVLERRREIGVMRSIGASSWRVIRLSIGEGVMLGWMSWLIALPLSIPAAYLLATRGLSFALNQQLAYRFSPQGALIWLVIITLLAILASTLPARSAARVSVRDSLNY